jgi:hypothetical protein
LNCEFDLGSVDASIIFIKSLLNVRSCNFFKVVFRTVPNDFFSVRALNGRVWTDIDWGKRFVDLVKSASDTGREHHSGPTHQDKLRRSLRPLGLVKRVVLRQYVVIENSNIECIAPTWIASIRFPRSDGRIVTGWTDPPQSDVHANLLVGVTIKQVSGKQFLTHRGILLFRTGGCGRVFNATAGAKPFLIAFS